MTDTPRTEDELLGIFADAQPAGSITPQDMRDLTVSTRPSPLYKRNWGGLVYKDGSTSIKTIPAAGATTYGTATPLGFRSAKPAGSTYTVVGEELLSGSFSLAGSDPSNVYGVDIAVDQAVMLPPGVWFYSALVDVTAADAVAVPANSAVTFPVELFFDPVSYDPGFAGPQDGTIPYLWANVGTMWNGPTFPRINAFPRGQDAAGEYRNIIYSGINVNDTDVAKPFALFVQAQPGWTTDLHLVDYFVRTVQLR